MTIDVTKEEAARLLEDIYTSYDEGKLSASNETIKQLLKIAPPEYRGLWERVLTSRTQ